MKFNMDLQLFNNGIPTSDDIYIRIITDGASKKVAVIQSYRTNKNKETKTLDAFGEKDSVGTYGAKTSYDLEIERAYVTNEALTDGIYLDELEDFDVIIEKPDRSDMYLKCNWQTIGESGNLKDKTVENMKVMASKFKRVKK